MALLPMILIFWVLLLTHHALALQVTPNSPCALICLDNPTQDVSDPNASNTYGSDIVCKNAEFENTPQGTKFTSCVNCLQSSTASGSGESDQGWFLYNLRFALDSCLFVSSNATTSSTHCSTDSSCGPLQQALEDGTVPPTNETLYPYCSANDSNVVSSYSSQCTGCLQNLSDQNYLANFVVALEAGCLQQPVAGSKIDLEGTVFSTNPVIFGFPGKEPSPSHKRVLSHGAIIALAVGMAFLLVLACKALFIWYRRKESMNRPTSPLDSLFGSRTITAPIPGAYGHPYVIAPVLASHQPETSAPSAKEPRALELEMPHSSVQHQIFEDPTTQDRWEDAYAHPSTQPPRYTATPTHHAYNTVQHTPISPSISTRIGTNVDTSQRSSPYASSSTRTSTRIVPPTIKVPPDTQTIPLGVQPSESPLRQDLPLRQEATHRQESPSRPAKPPTGQAPPLGPEMPQDTSQTSRPGFHSQRQLHSYQLSHSKQPSQEQLENHPPSQYNSRIGSWVRARSSRRAGHRDTDASVDGPPDPIHVSGPVIQHGNRSDFESAERERVEGGDGDTSRGPSGPD